MSSIMGVFTAYPYPEVLPTGFTLEHLSNTLFKETLFHRGLITSILLGGCVAIVATVLGFSIGRGIVNSKGKYRRILMGFFTIPLLFPAISMFIGVHLVALRIGAANTIGGVFLAQLLICIPYAMNIGISYFNGIPRELEQVSKLLGADSLRTWKKIVLPLLKGGMGLSLSMTFLLSISEYFATFLIGGGNVITLSGVMYPYIANFDMQKTAIISVVFLGINILVFSISSRWKNKHNYLY